MLCAAHGAGLQNVCPLGACPRAALAVTSVTLDRDSLALLVLAALWALVALVLLDLLERGGR